MRAQENSFAAWIQKRKRTVYFPKEFDREWKWFHAQARRKRWGFIETIGMFARAAFERQNSKRKST